MPSNISEFRGLKVSDALKSLVKRILVVAPEKRITCSEIL
jgi:chromosome segregation and condensation protein ScpB